MPNTTRNSSGKPQSSIDENTNEEKMSSSVVPESGAKERPKRTPEERRALRARRQQQEAIRKQRKIFRIVVLSCSFVLFLVIILGSASLISRIVRSKKAAKTQEEAELAEAGQEGEDAALSSQDDASAAEGEGASEGTAHDGTLPGLTEEQKAIISQAAQKAAEPVSITVSVVGDCTLGTDPAFDYESGLLNYYDNNGAAYFMQNVKSIFEADDLTIANLESALTNSEDQQEKEYTFKAPPEYVSILTSGSIEAVNTANNHSHDYGDEGYAETLSTLDSAGVVNFGYEKTAIMKIKGIKVGLVGIYELNDHMEKAAQLKENIEKVKSEGAVLTIVIFHWGNELDEAPDDNQLALGRMAIDAGADLVCGHHAHVLQGIETYKGKNIVYGLANFCFGGNSSPSDMDTMIYQQTFTIKDGKVTDTLDAAVTPCSVSSAAYYNNYQPTPASGDEASRILSKIEERSQNIYTADSPQSSFFSVLPSGQRVEGENAAAESPAATNEASSSVESGSSDSGSSGSGYDDSSYNEGYYSDEGEDWSDDSWDEQDYSYDDYSDYSEWDYEEY